MPDTTSPVIDLIVGGPQVEVHVACFTGPASDVPDSTSALRLPNPAAAPSIATASLDAAKPRSVILTPPASGTGGGPISIFVGEVGGQNNGLNLSVRSAPPPNVKSVVYVDHGPVQ